MTGQRRAWTKDEKNRIQSAYESDVFIKGKRLEDLAYQVDATPRQVKVWFQNRRQRENPSDVKWYENKRKRSVTPPECAPPDSPPEVVAPAFTPVVVSEVHKVDESADLPTSNFKLPVSFYWMLANMDEATLHQFSVRCLSLSFNLYLLFPPLYIHFMAEYLLRTCPDSVSLVLSALQTIVNEVRTRFYFTMNPVDGSMCALQCVLMALGFPMLSS